jgi:hypothetical protein
MAMSQYVADNDSAYPNLRSYWKQQVSKDSPWQQAIQPYIKNNQIWECPSEFRFPGLGTLGKTDYGFIATFFTVLDKTSPSGSGERLGSHETRHNNVDSTKLMTITDSALDGPLLGVDSCGPILSIKYSSTCPHVTPVVSTLHFWMVM